MTFDVAPASLQAATIVPAVMMFALLAFFGIELEPHDFRVAPVLLAVSAGSVTYWFNDGTAMHVGADGSIDHFDTEGNHW